MDSYYNGKVALVTGAASGMGQATAKAFAKAGAAVALADISEEAVQTVTKELVAEGHKALAIHCNVADEAQVAAMVDRTVATFGRLDAAFNNAGIQVPPSDAADEPAENFDRVIAVNLRGIWACMKHELRHMREQQCRGRICATGHPHQCGLPGDHRYPHGVRHAQDPGRSHEGDLARAIDRTAGPGG